MTTAVTIGKRLVPVAHIALIEPFDPSAHPGMKSDRPFKARVVLIDRQSVLTEEPLESFAAAQGFRFLAEEQIAINPAVRFSVETFAPTEGFEPSKPYKSRLMWRDLDGNTQSKLMLSQPEQVLAIAVNGEGEAPPRGEVAGPSEGRNGSMRPRTRRSRRRAVEREPA
jgi:hypothetical protein